MKTYTIPIIYQRVETITVNADNLTNASILALREFLSIPDDKYVCDSFEIDSIVEEEYDEVLKLTKINEAL